MLADLDSGLHGLTGLEAERRLAKLGPNALPRAKPLGLLRVFARQFASPLIYVLVAAAALSVVIHEFSDAAFIGAVLLVNAVIGTVQEFSAQRAAEALDRLVMTKARVVRDSDTYQVNAEDLVPGDIVLLESGDRVPADIRLLHAHDLDVDESLLTGESMATVKDADAVVAPDSALGDRPNLAYAGTLVSRGRGRGVVYATGMSTELGRIAEDVLGGEGAKPPLVLRMERFTNRVAVVVVIAALLTAVIGLARGMPVAEIFLLSVALAVSAIPEGLPVALTVALAIGMQRMARRNVIVRRLVAVEALGSCTFIATDKTGTLTKNQLSVRRIAFAGTAECEIGRDPLNPAEEIGGLAGENARFRPLIQSLCEAAVLANEGYLGRHGDHWVHSGDAVDVALLVMAHKAGVVQVDARGHYPELDTIPFESERQYAASINRYESGARMSVKGALERILPMCTSMTDLTGTVPIDTRRLQEHAGKLAERGYRVIALAAGEVEFDEATHTLESPVHDLTLLGLVGLSDPLRTEAKTAVAACKQAGIEVCMLTGDHPTTAFAIGQKLGLASDSAQVVSGSQLAASADADELVREGRVFARIEPRQKVEIVKSLQRSGHFVAVSGDGANDAPALRAAEVGVAMGQGGTDVARETADLILTDDNFASIVNGVEEGRIAYANVRKVIFLLVSTGAAEIVLFTLALFSGLPLPLLAVQLLWLNLVTNGIQDVALAFEPGEGNELRRPPRDPAEGVFNRLMLERVALSALVMGVMAFSVFRWLLENGYSVDSARNGTLLLMVLFENVHVFNSRSETLSAFRHSPLRNPILLVGTMAAQLIHIGAMYTPWIRDVLHVEPVSPDDWLQLLGLALAVLVAMELHKWLWHRRGRSHD